MDIGLPSSTKEDSSCDYAIFGVSPVEGFDGHLGRSRVRISRVVR